jgi:peptidoglycan/LPS O-acetylase OafA/YrhL
MTGKQTAAIGFAAPLAGAVAVVLVLSSEHLEAKVVWAVFGPAVGWSFIGTGLYAMRRRPESRTGALMVLFGFAWLASVLSVATRRGCTHSGWWSAACGAGCSCTS